MVKHFLPRGVDPMRTTQPTIHSLPVARGSFGAYRTLPDLTKDKAEVTCKTCLTKIAKYPNRY
jgi:hypothetical protein